MAKYSLEFEAPTRSHGGGEGLVSKETHYGGAHVQDVLHDTEFSKN